MNVKILYFTNATISNKISSLGSDCVYSGGSIVSPLKHFDAVAKILSKTYVVRTLKNNLLLILEIRIEW